MQQAVKAMSWFVLRLSFDSDLQRSKSPEQLCRGIRYVTVKYSSKVSREDLRSPCVGALLCLLWLYPWACHQAGWGLCALLRHSLNYHKSLNFILAFFPGQNDRRDLLWYLFSHSAPVSLLTQLFPEHRKEHQRGIHFILSSSWSDP